MKDLISIIIPVYNVEKYLDRCLESIVNQTYQNLEIILVDDGSQDNSGKMCDNWSQKDHRIKVFHKENGGVSSSRNVGIKKATGKYITFIDSDDYVVNNYLETLYSLMGNNIKVVRIMKDRHIDELNANSEQFLKIFENTTNFHPCTRQLIEKKLLDDNHIQFNEKTGFGEDLLFSIDIIMAAQKVKVIDFDGYRYCENPTSITRKVDKNAIMQNILELSIVYNEIYKKFDKKLENFRTNKFFEWTNRYIVELFSKCSVSYQDFEELMHKIYGNLDEIVFENFDRSQKYRGFQQNYINFIWKKKIKLYYIFMILRKKVKGEKNEQNEKLNKE